MTINSKSQESVLPQSPFAKDVPLRNTFSKGTSPKPGNFEKSTKFYIITINIYLHNARPVRASVPRTVAFSKTILPGIFAAVFPVRCVLNSEQRTKKNTL